VNTKNKSEGKKTESEVPSQPLHNKPILNGFPLANSISPFSSLIPSFQNHSLFSYIVLSPKQFLPQCVSLILNGIY